MQHGNKGRCRDGSVVRALASHRCDPRSILDRIRRHMWVELVVGSRPNPRVFLRVLRFSSLHKNEHSKSGNEGHRFVSFVVSVTLTK